MPEPTETVAPPLEIERKFLLVRAPDLSLLPDVRLLDLEQTYLLSGDEELEVRVRSRREDGRTSYFRTEKRRRSARTREESEQEISWRHYRRCLEQADPGRQTIVKTRHCFPFSGLTFELDQFHTPAGLWLLEAELGSEREQVELPDFLQIEREVTGERAYTNGELARRSA